MAPMNKVLVLYDSASGNTAKMAALVAEGAREVPEIEVRLRHLDVAVADDVLWCDGLALGSPTNMGLLFLEDETLLGCDHGAALDESRWQDRLRPFFIRRMGGGQELACQSLLTVLMNFGFLVFGVTDYAGKLTTLHYGAVSAREPRSDEVQEACRILGRRLAEWVAVFIGGRHDQHPLVKPVVRCRQPERRRSR